MPHQEIAPPNLGVGGQLTPFQGDRENPLAMQHAMQRNVSSLAQVGGSSIRNAGRPKKSHHRHEPPEFSMSTERIEYVMPGESLQEMDRMHSTKHTITPLNRGAQTKGRHVPQTADKAQSFEDYAGRHTRKTVPHYGRSSQPTHTRQACQLDQEEGALEKNQRN